MYVLLWLFCITGWVSVYVVVVFRIGCWGVFAFVLEFVDLTLCLCYVVGVVVGWFLMFVWTGFLLLILMSCLAAVGLHSDCNLVVGLCVWWLCVLVL